MNGAPLRMQRNLSPDWAKGRVQVLVSMSCVRVKREVADRSITPFLQQHICSSRYLTRIYSNRACVRLLRLRITCSSGIRCVCVPCLINLAPFQPDKATAIATLV